MKKLLYLDDLDSDLQIMQKYCDDFKIDCFCTHNIEEFAKRYESGEYDVAVVDFNMPAFDGAFIIQMLHKNNTKIYILTGYDISFADKVSQSISGVISKSEPPENIFKQLGLLDGL